tara:strand:+ start:798 stop:1409 length:612 start_codon:yes stop_codon:yes gene_type:complete
VLYIHSLYKSFNDNFILNNVSLKVNAGSLLLLRGINGSGKTTLLKVLSGISSYNSGKISFNNIDLNDDLYNKNINFLADKECLYTHLNIFNNLSLILNMQSIKHRKEEIEKTLKNLNLFEKKDFPINQLSAGQIQKIKIARMILQSNCNLCLLDEPETNLDSDGIKILIKCIKDWKSKNKVIVLATHNLDLYKELDPIFYELD